MSTLTKECEYVAHDASHLQEHFEALGALWIRKRLPVGSEMWSWTSANAKIIVERNDRFEDYSTTTYEVLVMAHPLKHAQNSVKKFGGQAEDYLAVHKWF